ncbi:hypothetical protein [Bradyrhizobium sp. USDA 329]|uniref:hypothetical protein n=1 Tax=unclassified Bradyrhizobium TaxID=2631580 RepID=UPI003518AB38
MQNELDTILAGLRANIQQEILNHRGNDVGLVASFTTNLRHHHQRVDAKFSNLRQVGADIAAIDAASSLPPR